MSRRTDVIRILIVAEAGCWVHVAHYTFLFYCVCMFEIFHNKSFKNIFHLPSNSYQERCHLVGDLESWQKISSILGEASCNIPTGSA